MTHVPHIRFQHNKLVTTHTETCYYPTSCWIGTTLTHPLSECMVRGGFLGCGWCGSLGQPPPLSEALLISDIFPVPLSRPCWKSQFLVRLDNTCNFQSGFLANINLCGASQHRRMPRQSHLWSPLTVMWRDPSIWGSIFSLLRVSTSVSSEFCGISLEVSHPWYLLMPQVLDCHVWSDVLQKGKVSKLVISRWRSVNISRMFFPTCFTLWLQSIVLNDQVMEMLMDQGLELVCQWAVVDQSKAAVTPQSDVHVQ